MTSTVPSAISPTLPDHTQLPESDSSFVKNFQEHPQSILLTDSIKPVLQTRHPEANYCIGQDCGIYWRLTDPPEKGAIAPDWFYVPDVPPTLNGQIRRSYVWLSKCRSRLKSGCSAKAGFLSTNHLSNTSSLNYFQIRVNLR
jgi:Uma2 family endonuclease